MANTTGQPRARDRDSTRMFLSRRDLTTQQPASPNGNANLLNSSSLVWTTNCSSNDHHLYGGHQPPAITSIGNAYHATPSQPLFPYRTVSQRPLPFQGMPTQMSGSFVNVNNVNGHQRLVSDYATPSLVNLNVTYDLSGGSASSSSQSGRSSRLSSNGVGNGTLQSESHIYSHICEIGSGGSGMTCCYCPACHDHRGGVNQDHPERQDLLSPSLAALTAMSAMPPLYESHRSSPVNAATTGNAVHSKLAAQVCGQLAGHHLPFPYQLKSTSSLYLGANSSLPSVPSSKKGGKKFFGLGRDSASSNGSSSSHHHHRKYLGQERYSRRCLLISAALAFLVILGLALLTSFVVFLFSSFETYYEEDAMFNETKPSYLRKDHHNLATSGSESMSVSDDFAAAVASSGLDFDTLGGEQLAGSGGGLTESGPLSGHISAEFRVTNIPYKETLKNGTSNDFVFLSTQLLASLKRFFQDSVPVLNKDLNETTIVAFRKGENFGLNGVIAELRLTLNAKRRLPSTARQVGLNFFRALNQTKGHLGDFFVVDMRTVYFNDSTLSGSGSSLNSNANVIGQWSDWSEWSSCEWRERSCDSTRIKSRARRCLRRGGNLTEEISPVFCAGLLALEIRDCVCPFKEIECNPRERCRADEEVCLLQVDITGRGAAEATCLKIRDKDDPRGCGGHCSGPGQLCRPLSNITPVFQCIEEHAYEEAGCLEEDEWRCRDGLCIPREKRCDGHFNCFDQSDEYHCAPCPTNEGWFHCGNETSCIEPTKRCDGVINCHDGSDEIGCNKACDVTAEFACRSGRCLERARFCDGVKDCEDDEPAGCEVGSNGSSRTG